MSDWICKNMATEMSLIYSLSESCSGACIFFWDGGWGNRLIVSEKLIKIYLLEPIQ